MGRWMQGDSRVCGLLDIDCSELTSHALMSLLKLVESNITARIGGRGCNMWLKRGRIVQISGCRGSKRLLCMFVTEDMSHELRLLLKSGSTTAPPFCSRRPLLLAVPADLNMPVKQRDVQYFEETKRNVSLSVPPQFSPRGDSLCVFVTEETSQEFTSAIVPA